MTADEADDSDEFFRALLALLADMDVRGERSRWSDRSSDLTSGRFSVSVGRFDEAIYSIGPDGSASPAITTRSREDGLLIAADLPSASAEEVSLEVDRDRNTATILVAEETIGRIPLDRGDWIVQDVTVTNHVMEARLVEE